MLTEVKKRYSQGAQQVQPDLCCPVDYDRALLSSLPQEIIDKDYGCGDPSRYVREGDVVLDLGSGGGKICYLAAQYRRDQVRETRCCLRRQGWWLLLMAPCACPSSSPR